MARFDRDPAAEGPLVQGFSNGCFSVDGTIYRGVFLTPRAASAWTPPPLSTLAPDDVAPLLALDPEPEFLILGTGARLAFPARAFIRALDERGVGVEVMDSRAAARTWGLLRGEERWIVAALMPFA